MRKMKIAFLSGGSNPFIEPYLQFFKARGHEVLFFSFARPIATKIETILFDISYGACGQNRSTKWRYFLAALKLRRVLKDIKPDILHGHYATSTGVISLISGFKPFVVSARGTDLIKAVKSPLWRMILRRVFAQSALVHTVSDELSALVRTLGVPQEKIMTLTQGVDVNLFDYKPRLSIYPPVSLLCTRALRYPYEPITILDACRRLKEKGVNFRVTFAAGGVMEDGLKKIATENELLDQIDFLGGYENALLPSILTEHDIYISSSPWDGTSVSLLEAMSCGVFPIVSRIKSNQAWLEEDKTALMFECGNAEELAEKIIRAISDNELRRSATEANRKLVKERAHREKNMLSLEEKYCEIIRQDC